MKQPKKLHLSCYLLLACLTIAGCRSIAIFDSVTFQRSSVLKARVLVVMDHADEPYEKYNDRIDSLMVEAYTIFAMEKVRDKNEQTTNQWNQMIGTKSSILTGFFSLWKQKKTLPEVFIDDAKPKVAAGFDEILKLEGAKLKN